jgi:flagellar biosynthesis protein FlhG
LVDAVAELEADSDVLVIDTAAGVGAAVTSFIRIADLALVVTTPEPTAVADAYALIKCVAGSMAGAGPAHQEPQVRTPMAMVVNQVADGVEAAGVHTRVSAVCERFLGLSVGLAGHVAHDLRVVAAVRSRRPFVLTHPKCEASRDMRQVALRVAQQIGVGRSSGGRERGGSGLAGLFARLLGGHGSESSAELLKSAP